MLNALLPWYWRWVALLLLMAAFGCYVGVEVANHYQDKINNLNAEAKTQVIHTKEVVVQQKDITNDVNSAVQTALASNNAYWAGKLRKQPTGSISVPSIPEASRSVDAEAETISSNSQGCSPQDGAADAITILGWQEWAKRELKIK